MHVTELWRHPVKSMQGESLDQAAIEASGLSGDRRWGVVDGETGKVLTARRVPSLLLARARVTGCGVEVRLPDGDVLTGRAHTDESCRACAPVAPFTPRARGRRAGSGRTS